VGLDPAQEEGVAELPVAAPCAMVWQLLLFHRCPAWGGCFSLGLSAVIWTTHSALVAGSGRLHNWCCMQVDCAWHSSLTVVPYLSSFLTCSVSLALPCVMFPLVFSLTFAGVVHLFLCRSYRAALLCSQPASETGHRAAAHHWL